MTRSLAAISTGSTRPAIDALLAHAAPTVRNPAGESVVVDAGWAEEVADDPQRLALLPLALMGLREAQEVWAFHEEMGEERIEHQPHLLWCRLDDVPETELVVAGTRRVDGLLELWTWFRVEEPLEVIGRYLRRGTRVFPLLRVRATYLKRIDVLYLRPDPPTSYRAMRITPDVPAYGYLAREPGYPTLVGLEIQSASRIASRLVDDPGLKCLMRTPTEMDGEPSTLGEHLARPVEWGEER